MKLRMPTTQTLRMFSRWLGWIASIAFVVLAFVFRGTWLPTTQNWVERTVASFRSGAGALDEAPDEGDAVGAAVDEVTTLELSDQALRNLGLTPELLQPLQLSTFRRSITVPALVVERPGRTRLQVAAPITGVVTHVHSVPGEAVKPGTLLFRIRLTHEDLVKVQTDFLRTLGELDVEHREISRLQAVTRSGAVAGRVLLEREYARDKLTALLNAEKEALRLHGLTTPQVEQIARNRRLLRDLQVFAPSTDRHDEDELQSTGSSVQRTALQIAARQTEDAREQSPLILSDLKVHKGQSVQAGETLCVLADYSQLFIEGLAFEQDAKQIASAARKKWHVAALFEQPGNSPETASRFPISRLGNEVDAESRTLRFYVQLPNRIQSDMIDAEGLRYVEWQYRPGQRLRLRVPVEEWPDQIVLPMDAVTKEGAEYYIFQQNGSQFDRVAVHVQFRDQRSAVIANDGTLFPGDVVALRGAHQMQMALKNKSNVGGAVHSHAGHSH